jgi:pimeloyl-ACP methyl ester carboxylesterase
VTRTQHSFVAPSGLSLAVHEWGGAGDPVVLSHPTGFHGVVWQPVAERLVAAGRRVWSFDFRGHGDSDKAPEGVYSWDGFADDAQAVLDHLGLLGDDRLLAVGHSKGATSLMTVAWRLPDAIPRIWAFEPIVFPRYDASLQDPDNPMSASARRRRAVWASREEAIASYGARPPLGVLTDEALHAYVDYGMRDLPDGTVTLKCLPEHEASIYTMGVVNGLWDRLPELATPVLVADGETSTAIPPSLATQIVERLPHGTLELWPGRGHFGPMEDPDRAVRSILDFSAAP